MMQDPDWIELSQEWDRMFQVTLPTIRLSIPGFPPRLVPDPGSIEEVRPIPALIPTEEPAALEVVPPVLPLPPLVKVISPPPAEAGSVQEGEDSEVRSVSSLRERFNSGVDATEPMLVAQRAAAAREALRQEVPEAAVMSSPSTTTSGKKGKIITPPASRVGSSPSGPLRFGFEEEKQQRRSSRATSSSVTSKVQGEEKSETNVSSPLSVKDRVQQLMQKNNNPKSPSVGEATSSVASKEWTFKKKKVSESMQPFLKNPAPAGIIPFIKSVNDNNQENENNQDVNDNNHDVEDEEMMSCSSHSLSSLLLKMPSDQDESRLHKHVIVARKKVKEIFFAAAYFFRYMHTKRRLAQGVYLVKLQEAKPGKVSPCFVGIDVEKNSLWWDSKGHVTNLPLSDLLWVEYGTKSRCFEKISNFSSSRKEAEVVILPWNCLTLVFKERTLNVYSDRKARGEVDVKTGKNKVVRVERVPKPFDTSREVDMLLFFLSIYFTESKAITRKVSGLFRSYAHLRWARSLIKLEYTSKSNKMPSFLQTL